ncbi:MAG: hypothetical protein HYT79_04125 [Elusimicrobia bacterium]|nr:hypothetical protein [Elusimicrobiota bacterium]
MNEKKDQENLCLEVLKKLHKVGVLQDLILVGSWCVYFYKDLLKNSKYVSTVRTTDIDFLIQTPPKISTSVDLPELFKELDFIPDHRSSGLIKLIHPQLTIEFLVPEKGKGDSGPYPIKALKITAQPLRFMNLLTDQLVILKTQGMMLRLPHPANYAFQKLIISNRRKKPEKRDKDRRQAIDILEAMDNNAFEEAKIILKSLPSNWQKTILNTLVKIQENTLTDRLVN